ncbi:MAG TPA: translocation/assembly module TamB domain-containing protein [Rubricoccaceae bacterium]|nr:translocation/assembly module TamB domain-containing protein [Rubricoccaceae bacterium]
MPRRLLVLPAYAVRAALLAALLGVVLFFGLTRTEVGRDALRAQAERSFAQRFQGRLAIGYLRGSLVGELHARDVRLYDPAGQLVLSADSVDLWPTWRALFTRAFVASRLVLHRPRLALLRHADGRWNLAEVFRPRRSRLGPARPLSLRLTTVEIADGEVRTSRRGAAPAIVRNGGLFDFTDALLTDLDARLALDWSPDEKRVVVRDFRGGLPDQGIRVRMLEGELFLEEGRVVAEHVRLATDRTRLAGQLVLGGLSGPARDLDLRVHLRPSHLDAREVRAFVPSSPLAADLDLAGRASGSLAEFDLVGLDLAHGASRLRGSGRVSGLPDSAAVAFELDPSTLHAEDLTTLLPLSLPEPLARLGTVELGGALAGSLRRSPAGLVVHLDSDLRLATDAGGFEGQLALRLVPGAALRYRVEGQTREFDPAALTGNPALVGRLNGYVGIAPVEASPSAGGVDFQIALGSSAFAGREADSLAAEGRWTGDRLDAVVALRQGPSQLRGHMGVDRSSPDAPALSFEGVARDFDLRQLLPEAPATRVSGPLRLVATGASAASLVAEVEGTFDRAEVTDAAGRWHALPLGEARLSLSPPGRAGPRLALTTEALTVRLDGDVPTLEALALGRQWGATLAQRWPMRPTTAPVPRRSSAPPRAFAFEMEVHQPDRLRVLLGALPDLTPGTTLSLSGLAGGDTLDASGDVAMPRFATSNAEARHVEARLALRAGRHTDGVELNVDARADSLRLGGLRFVAPVLALAVAGHEGHVTLSAPTDPTTGSGISLRAEIDSLDRSVRLTLDEVRLAAAGLTLTSRGRGAVLLQSDGVQIDGLTLVRAGEHGTPQEIALRGQVSASRTDTLFADVRGVDLAEIAEAARVRPFGALPGGRIDAQLAAVAVLGRPEITGAATIGQLTLGDRLVGELTATSQFVPGREGVAVEVHLEPVKSDRGATLRVERNDLHAEGTVRFPGRDAGGRRDPGALDLQLDVRRADLFFFDLLFPAVIADASGFLSGTGQIGGSFSRPVFEADLEAQYVSAAVPEFNLRFGGEGRLRVDREGVHLLESRFIDKRGGTATFTGSVLFNEYRYFSLGFEGVLNEVEVIDVAASSTLPFYGHLRASGTVGVEGPVDRVRLRSTDVVTTEDSELFIPITAEGAAADRGFLVYADSLGRIPERQVRQSVVGRRPTAERSFTEGLEMDLSLTAPPGSTVHLVFDPLIGDVITARGRAQLQLVRHGGEFQTFGQFTASGGAYLFTAGEVFTRRFLIEPGGTLTWEGDPVDARLDLTASYRTRASLAGLNVPGAERQRVPLVLRADVAGRLSAPLVGLRIDLDADPRASRSAAAEVLRPLLNDPDRQAIYATSVLLTGTFLLAPVENAATSGETLAGAADELLFTSLSQLVSTRLNLFLNQALASEHVEVLFDVQPTDLEGGLNAFDVTYGVALRFLDERLVIRGEGVYQQLETVSGTDALQGRVGVEVRLTPDVSLEVFYRRESELLGGAGVGTTPYGAYGVGLSYETQFASWRALLREMLE